MKLLIVNNKLVPNVALGGALTSKNITIQNCELDQTEDADTFLIDPS